MVDRSVEMWVSEKNRIHYLIFVKYMGIVHMFRTKITAKTECTHGIDHCEYPAADLII